MRQSLSCRAILQWLAIWFFGVLFVVLLFGCHKGYRPPIIDIREPPLYMGVAPGVPDVSDFVQMRRTQ